MQVSEQNKQEAEKVADNILSFIFRTSTNTEIMQLAIQDRQSVLEATKKIDHDYNLSTEITNLTEQIEYLKSKL